VAFYSEIDEVIMKHVRACGAGKVITQAEVVRACRKIAALPSYAHLQFRPIRVIDRLNRVIQGEQISTPPKPGEKRAIGEVAQDPRLTAPPVLRSINLLKNVNDGPPEQLNCLLFSKAMPHEVALGLMLERETVFDEKYAKLIKENAAKTREVLELTSELQGLRNPPSGESAVAIITKTELKVAKFLYEQLQAFGAGVRDYAKEKKRVLKFWKISSTEIPSSSGLTVAAGALNNVNIYDREHSPGFNNAWSNRRCWRWNWGRRW
jgi:hypothetical protein